MSLELVKSGSGFSIVGRFEDDGYGNYTLSEHSPNLLTISVGEERLKQIARKMGQSPPCVTPNVDVKRFPHLLYKFVQEGMQRGLALSISHDPDLPYIFNFAAAQLNQTLEGNELFDTATYYMDHEGTIRARVKGMTPQQLHEIEPLNMGKYLARVEEEIQRLSSLDQYFNTERYGTSHGVNYGMPTVMSKEEVDRVDEAFKSVGIDLHPELVRLLRARVNVVRPDSLIASILKRKTYYYPEDRELERFFQSHRFTGAIYDPSKPFSMAEFTSIDEAIEHVEKVTKRLKGLTELGKRTIEVRE